MTSKLKLSSVKESTGVFIRSGKTVGQCLIEVQLFPQTPFDFHEMVKENIAE